MSPATSARCEVIGDATLYLGDCAEVLPLLVNVAAIVTDPPYGILNLQGAGTTTAIRKSPRQQGSGTLKNRLLNQSNVEWDVAPSTALFDLMRSTSRHQIIWGGNYFPLPPARCILAWDKEQPWENFSQFELAWTNLDRPAGLYRASAVRSVPGKVHPTQKPLGLMVWCLGKLPDGDGAVCDPFMGSGTTGVACLQAGRRFIGIERDPLYFAMACERMREVADQATLFERGQTATSPAQELLL
jgi:site-specific DNA-methyltransferase (adenine-specific)/modification methylase